MNSPQPGSSWRKAAALRSPMAMPATMLLALLAAAPHVRAQELEADAGWRDVSVVEYRQHLQDLDALVAGCQEQRTAHDAAQPKAAEPNLDDCNPDRVGPNDRVRWPADSGSPPREVRYDWLRAVLGLAAEKGVPPQPHLLGPAADAKSRESSANELLAEAHQRLQEDAQEAARPVKTNTDSTSERKTLNAILAQKAYRGVSDVSPRERFLEWFYQQLDKFFTGLVRFGARAPWIVLALRVLLLAAICALLIWFLTRFQRDSRVKLIPDLAPAPEAPSAREWQLWLKDAHTMAANSRWREAIHFVYWAAIARLESKVDSRRPLPANRARTPREYLALLAGADPRKPTLTALTRSFERTWYGGREAASSDFKAALELAAALGVAAE